MKTKDEVAGLIIELIKQIQKYKGIAVKHIRCDNAGENTSLQDQIINIHQINCKFEFTAPAWKSKASRSVTLSSAEAEYVALSEVTKESMFVKQAIETMGIIIRLTIMVNIDNVGAIYLSNNISLGQRTKQIDIRRQFVSEFMEDGIFENFFVRTADNSADIYTKNTPEDIFEKHISKIHRM
jgi:hypothetical protein